MWNDRIVLPLPRWQTIRSIPLSKSILDPVISCLLLEKKGKNRKWLFDPIFESRSFRNRSVFENLGEEEDSFVVALWIFEVYWRLKIEKKKRNIFKYIYIVVEVVDRSGKLFRFLGECSVNVGCVDLKMERNGKGKWRRKSMYNDVGGKKFKLI